MSPEESQIAFGKDIRNSSWSTSTAIEWDSFSNGEELRFVRAKSEKDGTEEGFIFECCGILDGQGRFHLVSHEVKKNVIQNEVRA